MVYIKVSSLENSNQNSFAFERIFMIRQNIPFELPKIVKINEAEMC